MADNAGVQRGRYNKVSNADRNRLIDDFEGEQLDYLVVADTLGVKRQTARSIVLNYIRENRREALPRGGRRRSKTGQEMKNCLQQLLDENTLLTLKQLNERLQQQLPDKPYIAVGTLARSIDGMPITLKLAQDVPEARNADRVLRQR